jgi:hypothetical protein
MTCPERSLVIIACRPALPKFKIRWAVVQFPGCSLSSLTTYSLSAGTACHPVEAKDLCNMPAAPQRRQVADVPSAGSRQALRALKSAGPSAGPG